MGVWMSDHEHRLKLLRWLIGYSVLSTGIHFTHNFLSVEDYPLDFASDTASQVAIVITWPLLTAAGLYGYRLYKQRRYAPANLLIAVYSGLGLTTPGHFPFGDVDIPPFFYGTIFTDTLAGLSLLAFAFWSALRPLPGGEPVAA